MTSAPATPVTTSMALGGRGAPALPTSTPGDQSQPDTNTGSESTAAAPAAE